MRTYLVVIDETAEAITALRFAARRAAKTNGTLEVLALMPPADFVAWAGVQATMEDEAREHAESLVAAALETVSSEAHLAAPPSIHIRRGNAVQVVRATIDENPHIAALVLAAAPSGAPGPLVKAFIGSDMGKFPCPIILIPGGLSNAALDRLA